MTSDKHDKTVFKQTGGGADRTVIRPAELRPAVRLVDSINERSGVVLVIVSNSDTVAKRLPGDVGLYFLKAISCLPLRGPPSHGGQTS